jgi:splicing factor U2AF subunit
MAQHLQTIYGTEQDRVNCPFYFKIGACTYGERCSRLHNKPSESQTVLLINMYVSPFNQYGPNSEPLFDVGIAQSHLDDFYQDLFLELGNYGEIEEIHICRNLGDHLRGNVYVKYYEEEDATKCLNALRGKYYAGRPVVVELSPVTDFREARCRQYDVGECNRGGFCNFMHLQEPSRGLYKELEEWQRAVLRHKRWEAKKKREAERKEREEKKKRERESEQDTERESRTSERSNRKRRRFRSTEREEGTEAEREEGTETQDNKELTETQESNKNSESNQETQEQATETPVETS